MFVTATFECRIKFSRTKYRGFVYAGNYPPEASRLLQEVRRVGTTANVNEAGIEPNWLSLAGPINHVIDGSSS
jgi:hypothetical protein